MLRLKDFWTLDEQSLSLNVYWVVCNNICYDSFISSGNDVFDPKERKFESVGVRE